MASFTVTARLRGKAFSATATLLLPLAPRSPPGAVKVTLPVAGPPCAFFTTAVMLNVDPSLFSEPAVEVTVTLPLEPDVVDPEQAQINHQNSAADHNQREEVEGFDDRKEPQGVSYRLADGGVFAPFKKRQQRH